MGLGIACEPPDVSLIAWVRYRLGTAIMDASRTLRGQNEQGRCYV